MKRPKTSTLDLLVELFALANGKEGRGLEKYTEGRLFLFWNGEEGDKCSYTAILKDSPFAILYSARRTDKEKEKANMQRAIAAWNATLGIATTDLESGAIERLVKAGETLLEFTEAPFSLRSEIRAALSAFEKVEKGGES